MELCRYFGMPGGCVRGEKCFFAHGEDDLGRTKLASLGSKPSSNANSSMTSRAAKRMVEDTSKKVFVGGLPPSVESEALRDFFEVKFGPVMDAIVLASHSGDHIQSRGFGFVTFKDESSVRAAVQAHYITIIGKKVEIKNALGRPVLPNLDAGPAGCDLPSNTMQLEDTKLLDMSMGPLPYHSLDRCKGQLVKSHASSCVSVRYTGTENPSPDAFVPPTSRSMFQGSSPAWVTKFKRWLPRFLKEVSSRLKEGEWYPLSSLKGDFRATCGLELDHVGLGYNKLSDFIRSLSEICKMKIVPVGRGPATHMVLLPLSASNSAASLVCGSLVGPGRSYAAAAYVKSDSPLQVAPLALSTINHQTSPCSLTRSDPEKDAVLDDGIPCTLTRQSTLSPGICRYQAPLQHQPSGTTVSHQEEDSASIAELISILRHTDQENISTKLYQTDDSPRSDMALGSTHFTDDQAFPSFVHLEGNAEPHHLYASARGPESGIRRVSFKASPGECSSASPLSRESSLYSIWGQKLQSNTFDQDSPQSVLSSAFRCYSPHRSKLTSLCPASPSEGEREYSEEIRLDTFFPDTFFW